MLVSCSTRIAFEGAGRSRGWGQRSELLFRLNFLNGQRIWEPHRHFLGKCPWKHTCCCRGFNHPKMTSEAPFPLLCPWFIYGTTKHNICCLQPGTMTWVQKCSSSRSFLCLFSSNFILHFFNTKAHSGCPQTPSRHCWRAPKCPLPNLVSLFDRKCS